MIPLEQAIARLLERCDTEDANPDPRMRYLYTDEIRYLLGIGDPPHYGDLREAIRRQELGNPLRLCRLCRRERHVNNLAERKDGTWMCAYGLCPS